MHTPSLSRACLLKASNKRANRPVKLRGRPGRICEAIGGEAGLIGRAGPNYPLGFGKVPERSNGVVSKCVASDEAAIFPRELTIRGNTCKPDLSATRPPQKTC
jgi:hypothetical protein